MGIWAFSGILHDEAKYKLWRQAVRQKVGDFKCIDTLELQAKSFDFGHVLGVMAAISILTQNVAELKKPSNWKEAVKERWYPKWALKRWPIKYDTINIKALYPNLLHQDTQVIFKATRS